MRFIAEERYLYEDDEECSSGLVDRWEGERQESLGELPRLETEARRLNMEQKMSIQKNMGIRRPNDGDQYTWTFKNTALDSFNTMMVFLLLNPLKTAQIANFLFSYRLPSKIKRRHFIFE